MRKRLLASLIVCVALLTQFGASFWGAAAARDGYVGCHRAVNALAADDRTAPGQVPPAHDHESCALCQLGFAVVDSAGPLLPVRAVAFAWQSRLPAVQQPPFLAVLNKSGPARAPPSRA
jgi:hypothetical protein